MSEIAGRIGQPATAMSRPLKRLTELGLVKKEVPFGVSEKSGKRSLYKIADPFFRTWFHIVAPYKSLYAEAPKETRVSVWHARKNNLFAQAWEELCRVSVPFLHRVIEDKVPQGPWLPARRYWHGKEPEIDIVAESVDGTKVLIGEVKWMEGPQSSASIQGIYRQRISRGLPEILQNRQKELVFALFIPTVLSELPSEDCIVITADHVIKALT